MATFDGNEYAPPAYGGGTVTIPVGLEHGDSLTYAGGVVVIPVGLEHLPIGTIVSFLMRGFDSHVSVNRIVYWVALSVDGDASEYLGSVGPVTDVCLIDEI